MSPSPTRAGCVTAVVDGLAIGDPTGAHLLLTPDALTYRRHGVDEPVSSHPWDTVLALDLDVPRRRSRRPGAVSVLLAAASEGIGLPWEPTIAPVRVTIDTPDGEQQIECDGHIGGYWARDVDVLAAAAHLLVAHPAARRVLALPTEALADLAAAADLPAGDEAAWLAERWDAHCGC
jgi:hypothetical protein